MITLPANVNRMTFSVEIIFFHKNNLTPKRENFRNSQIEIYKH